MLHYMKQPERHLPAGAAREPWLRVTFDGAALATAGATDLAIGVQSRRSADAADIVPVWLADNQGTAYRIASGPIAAGATVYPAADGKVSATATAVTVAETSFSATEGVAITAAAQDGDRLEIAPLYRLEIAPA